MSKYIQLSSGGNRLFLVADEVAAVTERSYANTQKRPSTILLKSGKEIAVDESLTQVYERLEAL